MTWAPFEGGSTIGQGGSEEGVILLDQENDLGARVTLERDGMTAPFTITCGIYGWMMHTYFLGNEAEAREDFEEIKAHLVRIIDLIPLAEDRESRAKSAKVSEAIKAFVDAYQ